MVDVTGFAIRFQHTAARRRLGCFLMRQQAAVCFNTQPPEGGWPCLLIFIYSVLVAPKLKEFQHTAARRRLECYHARL